MTVRILAAVVIFLAGGFVAGATLNECVPLLQERDVHENLIFILRHLLQEKVIGGEDLYKIASGKDPFADRHDQVAEIYRPIIVVALQNLNQHLIVQVNKLISESLEQNQARTRTIVATKPSLIRMNFLEIMPGHFYMGSPEDEKGRVGVREELHPVKISKAFKIADIPVTQWQFAMVMHTNPSENSFGDGAIEIPNLDTRISTKIRLKPNHPVETVSWFVAKQFIEKLNLLSDQDDPIVYQIIATHTPRKHYRLPTEAEREFVARNRGRWQGMYPEGVTAENLTQYAWFAENATATRAVGELSPFYIDGDKPIFDLLGNVYEWVEDIFSDDYGLSPLLCSFLTATDPKGPKTETYHRTLRGGGYSSSSNVLRLASRQFANYQSGFSQSGFRLVEDE